MVSNPNLLSLVTVGVTFAGALAGGAIGIALGLVLPMVTAGTFLLLLLGGPLVGMATGYALGSRWQVNKWIAMGEEIGVSPEESPTGIFPDAPMLTGVVQGHRVSVDKKQSGNSPSGPEGVSYYTEIEVILEPPAEGGLIIQQDGSASDWTHLDDDATVIQRDKFTAVGTSRTAVEAVLSDESREALSSAWDLAEVRLGDVGSLYDHDEQMQDADVPDYAASFAEGMMETSHGNPSTATNYGNGKLLDTDGVRRQIDALVAVVEAYEEADRSQSQ